MTEIQEEKFNFVRHELLELLQAIDHMQRESRLGHQKKQ